MIGTDDLDRALQQWFEADAPASAPAGFHASVMDRARTLRQRPGWATALPVRRSGRGRGITLLAAAALLLVGGALAGSGIVRLPSVVPPEPAPSVAALATASPDATTTPTPSAPPTPAPTLSLDLTWTELPIVESSINRFDEDATRVAWLDDRFVLVDVKSGVVRTSTDGEDWQALPPGDAARNYVDLLRGSFASWQDSAVGWWNPQEHGGGDIAGEPAITDRDNLQISRPPAPPTSTTPFKGRIESIGIGPKGIVAQVHSDLDLDAWITEKLGLRTNNDWTCCVKSLTFKDGVLELKLNDRPGLKVVWADEGFEPGDIFDGGFGWYSPDGERWTAMAPNDADYPGGSPSNVPTGFGQVVGVSDGFIASGGYPEGTCDNPDGECQGMWFSSDGLTWRLLETAAEVGLLPWQGGAFAIDGDGQSTLWTSGGFTELQVAVQPQGAVATGPLGIVSIADGQVLVSRDGIDSKVSSLPTGMPETPEPANVAVGDQSVLVLHQAPTGEFTWGQSLWLGTFEP